MRTDPFAHCQLSLTRRHRLILSTQVTKNQHKNSLCSKEIASKKGEKDSKFGGWIIRTDGGILHRNQTSTTADQNMMRRMNNDQGSDNNNKVQKSSMQQKRQYCIRYNIIDEPVDCRAPVESLAPSVSATRTQQMNKM